MATLLNERGWKILQTNPALGISVLESEAKGKGAGRGNVVLPRSRRAGAEAKRDEGREKPKGVLARFLRSIP